MQSLKNYNCQLSRAEGQSRIMPILIILFILAVVGYFVFIRDRAIAPDDQDLVAPGGEKSGFENLAELKKSGSFQDLKKFGNWPQTLLPKGRQNPFIISR